MTTVKWRIKGTDFANCDCSYGCPCQFNDLPTHGFCDVRKRSAARTVDGDSTRFFGKTSLHRVDAIRHREHLPDFLITD